MSTPRRRMGSPTPAPRRLPSPTARTRGGRTCAAPCPTRRSRAKNIRANTEETVKRSAPLERQNGMVTEAANSERETAGWWPSRYGQDDEAGALNEITPGKVLEAVGLVREGRIYDLAHVLHAGI